MDLIPEIKSLIALLSESSTACVMLDPPRPVANEVSRDLSASLIKLPKAPEVPVFEVDPLPGIKLVGFGSPGRDILGVGSSDVIALPAEARALESADALDTKTEEAAGTKPNGSKGLFCLLFSPEGRRVCVASATGVDSDGSLLAMPTELEFEGVNSTIPEPKFVVLNYPRSDKCVSFENDNVALRKVCSRSSYSLPSNQPGQAQVKS